PPRHAVALDALDVVVGEHGLEAYARAGRRSEDVVARAHLGEDEGGLVEEVVAVDVVAGGLDGDEVGPVAQPRAEGPLVHAEAAVRPPRRPVPHERAVDEHAVDRRGRHAEHHRPGLDGREHGAEAGEPVHHRRPSLGPDGTGSAKGVGPLLRHAVPGRKRWRSGTVTAAPLRDVSVTASSPSCARTAATWSNPSGTAATAAMQATANGRPSRSTEVGMPRSESGLGAADAARPRWK